MWVYFWAFHPDLLICISILGPYHTCSFVVKSEVRECDSSRCCFSRLFWLFRIFCDSKKILKFRYVFSLLFAVAHPLQPHGLQHPRLPCPSLSPGVCSHFILCLPLLLLPSIFPSIRVFSNELALCIRWPNYWIILYR